MTLFENRFDFVGNERRSFQEIENLKETSIPRAPLVCLRLTGHFPSYFGKFGIFSRLLMLRMQGRVIKRPLCQEHSFPLMTACMAIV